MRLHALSGDRAAAIRAYQACVRTLERELGVEPSEATRAVYHHVLKEQFAVRPFAPNTPKHPTRLGNLPAPLTPFIGREHEIAAVSTLLRRDDVRMLTLTGTGGTGKTRLGLQVAAGLLDEFEQGAFFVDLSPIRDPALVLTAIVQTLGVREAGAQSLVESLKGYLYDKHLLLVLDNFEQVVAAGPFVTELLEAAPQLKVLVTSREALRLYGEHDFEVPPLVVPELRDLPRYEVLMQNEAVKLFINHAQAVNPRFVLSEENASLVAEICMRLDGLPLAIELAAARTKRLPLEVMFEQMNSRLALLTDGWRNKPARHQTLRSAIDWSYNLLDASEQKLFARLAVFVGGCRREAVEAVCKLEGEIGRDVEEGLESLVDKSLLQEVMVEGAPRFTMLETIREYALERLIESGDAELLQQQHARYFVTLAEMAEPELSGPQQTGWLERLEQEHDNLRAVLIWALEGGDATLGVRLAGALVRFWQTRGHLSEGRRWFDALLSNNNGTLPVSLRAKALNHLGWLASYQGDYPAARPILEESLALWRTLENQAGIALALNNLGNVAMYQGDSDRAKMLFEESLALRRKLGDMLGIASSLNNLGNVASDQGDYERAIALHEESLALRREHGDKWLIAVSLNNLGLIALYQGNYGRMITLLEESLALFRELGDQDAAAFSLGNLGFAALYQNNYERAKLLFEESLAIFGEVGDKEGIANGLEGLAGVAAVQGQAERAARLWGAAEALRDAIGAPLPPADRIRYQPYLTAASTSLGRAAFAAAWAEGQVMPLEQAVAYALSESTSD
jgi:predicted ATPase/Tfp pilus assembly protein PilF